MGRYLSWLANAGLFALCCFLVASTANTVLAAWLAPAPAELAPIAAPPPTTGTSWADRQVILSRNLFNASLLSPSAPEQTDDLADLEATSLPLVLLGTYNATTNPDDSWAAIEDQETREHLVLRLRDDVKGGKASVVRIERKRIVLDENGKLRVLEFDEGEALAAALPPALAARRTRRTAAAPAHRPPLVAPPAAEPTRNPAQLLAGGRPMPKYQDGQMVGFTVSNIEPGSLYERAGLNEGDLITEVNGVALNDPQQGARFVMEFAQAEAVSLTVQRADGTTESIDVPLP
jgi:general secretion pathway protein C